MVLAASANKIEGWMIRVHLVLVWEKVQNGLREGSFCKKAVLRSGE